MKAITLQKRIEKHLCTKVGGVYSYYNEAIELIKNPTRTMRPVKWLKKGKYLSDHSAHLIEALTLIGVDFECGNDAPRGGKEGFFVRLTAKGMRQVKDFAEEQALGRQIEHIGLYLNLRKRTAEGKQAKALIYNPDETLYLNEWLSWNHPTTGEHIIDSPVARVLHTMGVDFEEGVTERNGKATYFLHLTEKGKQLADTFTTSKNQRTLF